MHKILKVCFGTFPYFSLGVLLDFSFFISTPKRPKKAMEGKSRQNYWEAITSPPQMRLGSVVPPEHSYFSFQTCHLLFATRCCGWLAVGQALWGSCANAVQRKLVFRLFQLSSEKKYFKHNWFFGHLGSMDMLCMHMKPLGKLFLGVHLYAFQKIYKNGDETWTEMDPLLMPICTKNSVVSECSNRGGRLNVFWAVLGGVVFKETW